jgi:hypothetical protein
MNRQFPTYSAWISRLAVAAITLVMLPQWLTAADEPQ